MADFQDVFNRYVWFQPKEQPDTAAALPSDFARARKMLEEDKEKFQEDAAALLLPYLKATFRPRKNAKDWIGIEMELPCAAKTMKIAQVKFIKGKPIPAVTLDVVFRIDVQNLRNEENKEEDLWLRKHGHKIDKAIHIAWSIKGPGMKGIDLKMGDYKMSYMDIASNADFQSDADLQTVESKGEDANSWVKKHAETVGIKIFMWDWSPEEQPELDFFPEAFLEIREKAVCETVDEEGVARDEAICARLSEFVSGGLLLRNIDGIEEFLTDQGLNGAVLKPDRLTVLGFRFSEGYTLPSLYTEAFLQVPLKRGKKKDKFLEWLELNNPNFDFGVGFWWEFDEPGLDGFGLCWDEAYHSGLSIDGWEPSDDCWSSE